MVGLEPFKFVLMPGFEIGLAVSVSGVAMTAGVRRWRSAKAPFASAGLIPTIAGGLALYLRGDLHAGVAIALIILALAGWVVDSGSAPLFVAAAVAAPGLAVLVWVGRLPDVTWIRVAVICSGSIGGALVSQFDDRFADRGWAPPLFAISAVGVYYTVPDTEIAVVVLGASLPLFLLGWPRRDSRLGVGGSFAAVGFMSWVVGISGFGRQSSIVGGLACLGLPAAAPLASALRTGLNPLTRLPRRGWAMGVVAAGHLGLVFIASRVAGTLDAKPYRGGPLARGAVGGAAVIVAAEYVAAVSLLVLTTTPERPPA